MFFYDKNVGEGMTPDEQTLDPHWTQGKTAL